MIHLGSATKRKCHYCGNREYGEQQGVNGVLRNICNNCFKKSGTCDTCGELAFELHKLEAEDKVWEVCNDCFEESELTGCIYDKN